MIENGPVISVTLTWLVPTGSFHYYLKFFLQAYDFWGILWFSAGLSYLLILMTESPIIVIEEILIRKCFFPVVVPFSQ
jgi:hypothetical protein